MNILLITVAVIVYLVVYFICYSDKNSFYDNHKFSMLFTLISCAGVYWVYTTQSPKKEQLGSSEPIYLEEILTDSY